MMSDAELIEVSDPPVVGDLTDFYDLWIGRKNKERGQEHSEWANPFSVRDFGLEMSIQHYEEYLRNRPDLLAKIPTLRGLTLACTCRSSEHQSPLCHGDVIRDLYLEWARARVEEQPDYFKRKA